MARRHGAVQLAQVPVRLAGEVFDHAQGVDEVAAGNAVR